MGCNTSSEAKGKEEKDNTQENNVNAATDSYPRAKELQRKKTSAKMKLFILLALIALWINPSASLREEQNKNSKEEKPPKEVEAATKIQAVFRGHQTRKTMSMKAAKQQTVQPVKQAQKEPQKEPEPTKAELEAEFRADDKDLCNAATKIQASFRGHQARKTQEVDAAAQAQKDQELQDKEDIEKIDLTDPDLNKAATKIQASFRGHKVRKDVI